MSNKRTKNFIMKILKTIALLTIATFSSIPTMGQDLLARQAPIDRKMKAVDSVALNRLIDFESYESPSADLYDDWDNLHAHSRVTAMPEVYIGDTIRAAFRGKVRVVQYEGRGYGKYVVIRHDNGLETYYAHLSKQLVYEDQEVRAGDPIGLGGNTGRSTGSHLHFETRLCGVALNPALMFDFRNQDVVDDYFVFHKSTYQKESALANRLRGVGGASFGSNNRSEEVELATAAPAASYAQETRFHKVKKGETLYSIARHRGTTVDAIMKLNHLKKSSKLKPGQILKFN